MKNLVRSFQEDLSNEVVTEIFINNTIKVEEGIILYQVGRELKGSGHYDLTIDLEFNGEYMVFKATTTNMSIIDDWGESDDYFESDDSGHWFDNNEQVFQAALDHVLEYRKDEINDWLKECK